MTGVVFIPILPKGKPVDSESAFRTALAEEAKLAEKGLKLPASTWETQVEFETKNADTFSDMATKVFTTNEIYGFNDAGTKPHIISARRARTLRFFKTGFVSKTRPGRLQARAGRRANQDEVFPLDVAHPGTEARGFSKQVAKNGKITSADS